MAPATPSPTRGGRLILSAIGLAFLCGGLAGGYFSTWSDAHTWMAARGFVSVPAELLHVELKTHSGGKEDATTYRVQARYRYSVGGRQYVSERVGIMGGADNFGSYHQDMHAALNAAYTQHTPVIAWVNPANPGEALLDREMRWVLLGVKSVLFGVLALAGLAICIYGLRVKIPAPAPVDKPWLNNPTWRDKRIATTSRPIWTSLALAIFLTLVSAPMLFALPDELARGNKLILIGLLFPLLGTWMLYQAVYKALQWRRFGAFALELDPFPGIIGGTVSGTIELPERFRSKEMFQVTLTCVHRRITYSGSGRDRSREVFDTALWQDEAIMRAELSGRGTRLAFRFNVPPDLPPTEPESDDYHRWVVHVRADLPGVDLDHGFEVPIIAAVQGTAATAAAPATAPPAIPANIVRIKHLAGATVFYYPLLRHPALGIGLLVFGLVFGGMVAPMHTALPEGLMAIPAWFMIAAFSLAGGGLLLLGLYTLGNSLRVDISPRGLTTTRRVFGFPFVRHVALNEIERIEARIGSQSNGENRFRTRYSLKALTRHQRRIAVGEDIPGPRLAEHLAQLVRDACGIRA